MDGADAIEITRAISLNIAPLAAAVSLAWAS